MNERIHAFLDGELPRAALSDDELHQVRAIEAQFAAIATTVDQPAAVDIASRVMARIGEIDAPVPNSESVFRRFSRWIWEPRLLTWECRPAYGLAGAFAAILLMLSVGTMIPAGPAQRSAPVAGATEETPRLYVQFRLEAPGAESVELAGTFTGWSPEYQLVESAPGVWSTLVPLDPGVHDYTFVVDGQEWVIDPYAPEVADDFGGSNSRLFLPEPAIGA